jgi:hypothetical protein
MRWFEKRKNLFKFLREPTHTLTHKSNYTKAEKYIIYCLLLRKKKLNSFWRNKRQRRYDSFYFTNQKWLRNTLTNFPRELFMGWARISKKFRFSFRKSRPKRSNHHGLQNPMCDSIEIYVLFILPKTVCQTFCVTKTTTEKKKQTRRKSLNIREIQFMGSLEECI